MANAFDRLPPNPVGSQDKNAVYLAVGHALSAWEELETEQANLFGQIVQGGFGVAVAIYGLSTSVTAKREMLDTALDWLMHENEGLAKEIKSALAMTGNLAARRNDIAHGQVHGLEINRGMRLGYYLLPGMQATKKFKPLALVRRSEKGPMSTTDFMTKTFAYAYTADQIDHYRDLFRAHAKVIKSLVGKVMIQRPIAEERPAPNDK